MIQITSSDYEVDCESMIWDYYESSETSRKCRNHETHLKELQNSDFMEDPYLFENVDEEDILS